jgi:hypothetical protein
LVSIDQYRKLALSFPEVIELPHFHLASFRVKKKIFSTLSEQDKRVMVKLSTLDQSVFCAFDATIIYPVPGGWGTKGATYIDLNRIRKSMLEDALKTAYCTVAPKELAEQLRRK